MQRTHTNGELRIENIGQEVILCGWVAKRRNLGSLVFMDLRDRYGITQIIFNETLSEAIKDVRNEYVLKVVGSVQKRESINPKIETGDIEVMVKEFEILNTAKTTPLIIADETDALEDVRLKYRYLDIRRNPIKNNLILRDKITTIIRNYLHKLDFIEVDTPILGKSTPEGARDYLVPSRIFPGSYYALPQSPQIYKQLLMIGGLDRYFQIAKCFRDEDLRADRQPEFTQIDLEMSFVTEEDVFEVVEGLMRSIFKETKNIELTNFKRITYKEALENYGSDKPDLRFDLALKDLSSIFKNTDFEVFKHVLAQNGIISSIVLKNKADNFSRKDLDRLSEYVKTFNAKYLSYLKYNDGFSGSIFKGLSANELDAIKETLNIENNDLILIVADDAKIVYQSLGALRVKLGKELNLINQDDYQFVWITDFPMYEYSSEEKRYVACHHPFTAPKQEHVDKLIDDPQNCLARAYDLVLNGYELLSGSVRIFDQTMQEKVFEALGLSKEQALEKFGFFLKAFEFGTPPHAGVGIGLERLIMILANTENIRDVIAFPKTASASCLMSEAPNTVDLKQLSDLKIKNY